ncbi:MAG: hypothetical protein J6W75_05670 [Bacteroidaceae bacterium]|nr:hypothetical protein [Bacteroidaceae bacterium]
MKYFTLILVAVATLCTPSVAQNRVKNLYTFSSKLNVEQLQQADQPVQINRTLMAGYNTLCLPMTLTSQQLQAAAKDVRVERLAAIRQEGNTLQLCFIDCTNEGIEAGRPYLIFSPTLQNLHVRNIDATAVSTHLLPVTMTDQRGNRVTFSSSWESITCDGRYGIPAQQNVEVLESVLLRTSGDKTFLPTRCGVTWDAQAPGATELEIKHIFDADAIESLKANVENGAAVYDLNGRRTERSAAKRGVYVVGGQKVAVK